jgi:hypothetical protein
MILPTSPPLATPEWAKAGDKKLGGVSSETSLDGKGEVGAEGEDKAVTWCHRMRTTRDHAEIPELMEVLGLDGHGEPVGDKGLWEKALRERKGTGVSLAGDMNAMRDGAGVA